MRLVPLLVLAACSKPPAPEAPSNTAPNEGKPVPTPGSGTIVGTDNPLSSGGPGTCVVGGRTVDPKGEVIPGVTFVIKSGSTTETTISDDSGHFVLHRTTPPDTIAAYYADLTIEAAYLPQWCGMALRVEIVETVH